MLMTFLLFEEAVVNTAVSADKPDFDFPLFSAADLPNNDVTRAGIVQMAMMDIFCADDQAIVAPPCLFGAFLFQIMLQQV
jgi:hypothetical protein